LAALVRSACSFAMHASVHASTPYVLHLLLLLLLLLQGHVP
jgi:hypothetical protein